MQRAYDNIIHDVAIQKLNVVFCLDRAGLVGEDGPTHHGVFDMAYLRPIPNLTISSPMDEHELRRLMYTAQLPDKGPLPSVIRAGGVRWWTGNVRWKRFRWKRTETKGRKRSGSNYNRPYRQVGCPCHRTC